MTIVRISHNKENPYVMLNKSALEDKELSWGAKGLWAYLMSRPDDWKVSVSHLSKIYEERGGGERAIYNLLNELIDVGYCIRTQEQAADGKFLPNEYLIVEFKKCLPNRSQADAASADAVHSATTNKGSIHMKETAASKEAAPAAAAFSAKENPKRKQAPEVSSPPPPPDPEPIECQIYACLLDLDISAADRVWITKHYPEDIVKNAVEWATHPQTKISTTLVQAIKWACSNKPETPKSTEEKKKETIEKTVALLKTVKKPSNDIRIDVCNEYVEVYNNQCNLSTCIKYSEKGYMEQLKHTLRKYGCTIGGT